MAIRTEKVIGPVIFASALVNGDWSGLTEEEQKRCEEFVDNHIGMGDVAGLGDEDPWFTWNYEQYGGGARGGDVCTYIVAYHEPDTITI